MQVQLSDVVRWYAAEMAYASKCGTVEKIRDTVDHPPTVKDKTDLVGIGSIQIYGKSIVNMRATDPKQRYAIAQAPSRYDSSYSIYHECMEEIKSARKEPIQDLENRILQFRERVSILSKTSEESDASCEDISFPIQEANNSMVVRKKEDPRGWCVVS